GGAGARAAGQAVGGAGHAPRRPRGRGGAGGRGRRGPRGGATWSSPRLSSRRRGRTRPPGRARGAAADGAPACGRARIAAGVGAHKREKRDEVSQRPRWPVLLPLLVDSTRVARLEHLVPRGTHG